MKSGMKMKATGLLILIVFLASACATYGPVGPTMPALIGAGKTTAHFSADDLNCRQLATARAGDPAMVQQQQAGSAILGVLLGAVAGAALGGAIGGGRGAGIGAAAGGAAGLGTGLGAGTAQAQSDASRIQSRWDAEYYSCMYAAGHQIPGAAAPRSAPTPPVYNPPPPPPPASYGPPPAQAAPPPPAAAPCEPTGKYVKTPQGFVPECR